MTEFRKRLKAVKKAGGLRTAEIARWFRKPYATVYGWIEHGRAPDFANALESREAYRRMESLERRVRQTRFPLRGLTRAQRKAALQ